MSGCFNSNGVDRVDLEQLLEIGLISKERLEYDVKTLSTARAEDKRHIKELERELNNCSQEIEYLQDQLNLRNTEANFMVKHVHSLELKLTEIQSLHEKVNFLTEALQQSDSERLLLTQQLEQKELELQNLNLSIERLETTLSSIELETECELEGVKLDLAAMEHRLFETEKLRQEASQEKDIMHAQIEELQARVVDLQKQVNHVEQDNKELCRMLGESDKNGTTSCDEVAEHLENWMKSKGRLQSLPQDLDVSEHSIRSVEENSMPRCTGTCTCEDTLGPLLSKLAVLIASDEKLKDGMQKIYHQLCESENLIEKLKEELREEKLKAKEEAEDLTQEMAELRYQITDMLEQECKRRASVEQASLQRISQLEAEVQKERQRALISIRQLDEAQKLMKAMSIKGSQTSKDQPESSQNNVDSDGRECMTLRYSMDSVDEWNAEKNGTGNVLNQGTLGWYSDETAG